MAGPRHRRLIVLGLTGSIGMGKTTAARALRRFGLPVFEADDTVHRMLAPGGAAAAAVAAAFPGAVRDGAVDRRRLGKIVFGDDAALARLEAILHPLVRAAERRFLRRAAARRAPMAVLDLPLLFETGADRLCDATILLTAPSPVQRARILRRPGMTAQRLEAILAHQMPDREKRRRADFILPTGLGQRVTLNRLKEVVTLMRTGRRRFPRGARRRLGFRARGHAQFRPQLRPQLRP